MWVQLLLDACITLETRGEVTARPHVGSGAEAAGFPEDASPEPGPPSVAATASVVPSTTLAMKQETETRSLAAMDMNALVVFDQMPSRWCTTVCVLRLLGVKPAWCILPSGVAGLSVRGAWLLVSTDFGASICGCGVVFSYIL